MVTEHLGKVFETAAQARDRLSKLVSVVLRKDADEISRQREYSDLLKLKERATILLDYYTERPGAIKSNAGNIREFSLYLMESCASGLSRSDRKPSINETATLRKIGQLGGLLKYFSDLSSNNTIESAFAVGEYRAYRADSLADIAKKNYVLADENYLSELVLSAELNMQGQAIAEGARYARTQLKGQLKIGFAFGASGAEDAYDGIGADTLIPDEEESEDYIDTDETPDLGPGARK